MLGTKIYVYVKRFFAKHLASHYLTIIAFKRHASKSIAAAVLDQIYLRLDLKMSSNKMGLTYKNLRLEVA